MSIPNLQIACINESTVVSPTDFANQVAALQIQAGHIKKFWNQTATLHDVAKGSSIPASYAQLVWLDNSDQAGALGYHDLTASGMPLGKVFAGTDLHYGYKVSVTASHEFGEMLIDPYINLCTGPMSNNLIYAYELCDACEADNLGYDITLGDGTKVTVSDFCTPYWWIEGLTTAHPLDYMKHITHPLQILPGGYIGVYDGHTWTQKTSEHHTAHPSDVPPVGSRRERRMRMARHEPMLRSSQ